MGKLEQPRQGGPSPATLRVLHQLAALQSLHVIREHTGDFLIDGYLSPVQARLAQEQWHATLLALRPESVALVDAFGFDDYELHDSAIGCSSGRVYEALLDRAAKSPLNSSQEGPAYSTVLRPRLRSKQVTSRL